LVRLEFAGQFGTECFDQCCEFRVELSPDLGDPRIAVAVESSHQAGRCR